MPTKSTLKKERAKIQALKRNYIDKPIDPESKVDDTYGYENWVVVDAKFWTVQYDLKTNGKRDKKMEVGFVGKVLLEKLANEAPSEDNSPRNSGKNNGELCLCLNFLNIRFIANADPKSRDNSLKSPLTKFNTGIEFAFAKDGMFKFNKNKLDKRKSSNSDEFDEIIERKAMYDSFDNLM